MPDDGQTAPLTAMTLDPYNWSPLSVGEVARVFQPIPIPWWIAGGTALDLFLGRTTRRHEDIDVLILRRDQLLAQRHLPGWLLFRTQAPDPPHLAPWPQGVFLEPPVNSVWVRSEDHGPWRFEIMLMETEGHEWVYRRLRSIRGPIADLGLETEDGIPYLRPEIQLLYKSGTGREKDSDDLARVLPRLRQQRASWLLRSLRSQYPQGHDWLDAVSAVAPQEPDPRAQ